MQFKQKKSKKPFSKCWEDTTPGLSNLDKRPHFPASAPRGPKSLPPLLQAVRHSVSSEKWPKAEQTSQGFWEQCVQRKDCKVGPLGPTLVVTPRQRGQILVQISKQVSDRQSSQPLAELRKVEERLQSLSSIYLQKVEGRKNNFPSIQLYSWLRHPALKRQINRRKANQLHSRLVWELTKIGD